eukprot:403371632
MKKSQSEQKLLPPVILYRPVGAPIPKEYNKIAQQYISKTNLSPPQKSDPPLIKNITKILEQQAQIPSRNIPLRPGGTGGQFTQQELFMSIGTPRTTSTSTKNQFLSGIRDNYVPLTARENRQNLSQLRQFSTAHQELRQSPKYIQESRTHRDSQQNNFLSKTQSTQLFKYKGKNADFTQSYVHGHMFENNTLFKESHSKQRLNLHLQHLKILDQNKQTRQQWREEIRDKTLKLIKKYKLEDQYLSQIDFLVTLPLVKVREMLKQEFTNILKQKSALKLQTSWRMKLSQKRFKTRKQLVLQAVQTIQKMWRALKIFEIKKRELYMKRSNAAVKIQKFIRGQLCRKQMRIEMEAKLKLNNLFFDQLREFHYLPYVKKLIGWWRIRLDKIRLERRQKVYRCFIWWAVKFFKTKIKKYMKQKSNKNKHKLKLGADRGRKSKEKLNTSQNNNQANNTRNTKQNEIGVIPLYNEDKVKQQIEINQLEQQDMHLRDNLQSANSQRKDNFDDISKMAIDKHIEKLDFDKMKKAQLAVLPRAAAQDEEGNVTIAKKNDFQLMSLDIEDLQKQIKALDPHFTTTTVSKTINELNITPEEYLRYNQYLLSLQESQGYLLQHISLVEFVLHDRLKRLSSAQIENQSDKDSFKKFSLEQFQEMRNQIKDPSRNKLLELKRMLNFVLQNDANKDIGSTYYDLENYEEEENDQQQTIEEVMRKAYPNQYNSNDPENIDAVDVQNAEKLLLKDFNNQVMNRPIIFKPKTQTLQKQDSTKNISFGLQSGIDNTTTTFVNQNDPLLMQNILKGNVRIIRGVGTEDNDTESQDKIRQIFGQTKRKSLAGSSKSPSKSNTSRITGSTSLDKKSDSNLQSRNKLRVMVKRNQTLPTQGGQTERQNFDSQRSRMNIIKNNYNEKTMLRNPLQQDLENKNESIALNEDLNIQNYENQNNQYNNFATSHKINPLHLDLIEEQTEDEIYPSTCLAMPQRRQTIQNLPQQFNLKSEKGLYKDEDLIDEKPEHTYKKSQFQTLDKGQYQLSNAESDQIDSNLSNYSPVQREIEILENGQQVDNLQEQTDSQIDNLTYQGIYQPVDKPYLKELNIKKNRNRFINRPVAVSKEKGQNTNTQNQLSQALKKGIAQKLKHQLTEEEQRYIKRMLGLSPVTNKKESGNRNEQIYEKGKILEQLHIPPPTSN